ncbi:MAG: hypothetical protein OET63_06330 [Desulfobacterales bacterium]|jgi:hypothetical protein|nr:hypothetical protein [Desulfobacterales bacterium]
MKKLNLNSSPQISHITFLELIMIIAITLAILSGCSHTEKVLIPPKVELKTYHNIGVIEFSTNAEDTLKPYVTQNFIQNVQSAQPGTRILELGDAEHLLRSLGHSRLNPETIQSIGRKYNVDAVILGHLQVSEIKPNIKVFAAAKTLNAKAYIEAALRTRILETDSGATLWTRATTGKTQVARVSLTEGGPFSFGVSDPKEKYGKLVPELVYVNTTDFRSRYEYRTVE